MQKMKKAYKIFDKIKRHLKKGYVKFYLLIRLSHLFHFASIITVIIIYK